MRGHTPDSLLALHDAGYREVAARLGPGVVVDVGCGVGEQTVRLTAPDRRVIGIDYSAASAAAAAATYPDLTTAAMDGGRLGLADASADYICSSHIIEHFTAPERHVAELARVLRPDGTALVLTPNEPADFENPFHVYLFTATTLRSMLAVFFEHVEVVGIEGDELFQADFAKRRAAGERILKLDPFNLRKKIPPKLYVAAYEHLLPQVYKLLGKDTTGIGSGIEESNLFVTDQINDTTPVLLAIASGPRRPA